MEIQIRDAFIDNIRGLAIISVIFIHTVFWSGSSYVPEYMRNISLLFDVPVFFLLTGMSFYFTGKLDVIKQIFKLIIYFSIFVFICQICFWEFNINNLIASLTLHNAIVPQLPLVNGSYWFVPMYCVSILVAYGIISTFKSKGVIFIILFICYYFFGYIQKISIEQSFLGVPVQSLLFYTSCVLFGYYLSRFRGNKLWLMVAVLSLCLFLFLIHGNPNAFNLQNYKFPIGLPYVVASFISLCIIMYGNFLKSRSCFTYIGKYSIFFYMGQCVGGSLIYQIVPFITLVWWVKIILLFSFNMLISIFIGYLLVKLFTLKFL